jgi:hypothetical protein
MALIQMMAIWGGIIFMLIGSVMILLEAFGAGVLWGLGCLLLPFVQLLFVATHWHLVKKAFVIQLIGAAAFFGGTFASARPHPTVEPAAEAAAPP